MNKRKLAAIIGGVIALILIVTLIVMIQRNRAYTREEIEEKIIEEVIPEPNDIKGYVEPETEETEEVSEASSDLSASDIWEQQLANGEVEYASEPDIIAEDLYQEDVPPAEDGIYVDAIHTEVLGLTEEQYLEIFRFAVDTLHIPKINGEITFVLYETFPDEERETFVILDSDMVLIYLDRNDGVYTITYSDTAESVEYVLIG